MPCDQTVEAGCFRGDVDLPALLGVSLSLYPAVNLFGRAAAVSPPRAVLSFP
jgi:hypothetical protein